LITGTSRQVNGLTAFTKYYWRVRSRNANGSGPYCLSRWFSTYLPVPNQIALVAPANNMRTQADTVVCVWRANNHPGTRYWFEITDDSLFAWPDLDSSLTDTVTIRRGLELERTYFWRVRAGNLTGWGPYSEIRRFRRSLTAVADERGLPSEVSLSQNYPNPFNPATTLRFAIPPRNTPGDKASLSRQTRPVTLTIYDMAGKAVRRLLAGNIGVGCHRVTWEGRDDAGNMAPSGIYFADFRSGRFAKRMKIALMK
jgi:hypothetical protein